MSGAMVSAVLVMHRARSFGVAKHDREAPVQRRQHEACGNKRAQAKHRQHERRRPMADATMPQLFSAVPCHPVKMP
jgi:hypothetical protein